MLCGFHSGASATLLSCFFGSFGVDDLCGSESQMAGVSVENCESLTVMISDLCPCVVFHRV